MVTSYKRSPVVCEILVPVTKGVEKGLAPAILAVCSTFKIYLDLDK